MIKMFRSGFFRVKGSKWFHRENILVILTIISVVLAVCISIPIRKLELDTKTIYGISLPGVILMNLLKMMILPLLLLSILSGLTSLNLSTSSKLGLYTVLYYVITTFIAVCMGMALVSIIHPGNKEIGQSIEGEVQRKLDPVDSIYDLFNNLFPDNIIRSTFQQFEMKFVNTSKTLKSSDTSKSSIVSFYMKPVVTFSNVPNFLGLIFFAIFFGVTLNTLGPKGQILVAIINAMNDLTMHMVNVILCYMPIGIFFLILSNLLNIKDLVTVIKTMGMFAVTVLTGLTIHMLIVLPAIFFVFVRKNPYKYMLGMSRAMVVAFVTQSSSVTIPVTMSCAEKNNKIDPRVTKFMLPIGAVINMDGTGLYEAVAAIFISQINGIELGIGAMIRISITSTLAAIGAATVPSAGLVTLLIVLSTAGLPSHQISLLYSLDWFLDRCRTSINILGDAFGCGIVQKLCRKELMADSDQGKMDITVL